MSETMVERVARAIAEASGALWEAEDHEGRALFRRDARAAIEAMREPTDEMVIAGLEAGARHNKPYEEKIRVTRSSGEFAAALVAVSSGGLYSTSYQAMVDAALSESMKGE